MLKLKLYSIHNQNNQGFETTILLGGAFIRHQLSSFLPFIISLIFLFIGSVGINGLIAQDTYYNGFMSLAYNGSNGTIDWNANPLLKVNDGSLDNAVGGSKEGGNSRAFNIANLKMEDDGLGAMSVDVDDTSTGTTTGSSLTISHTTMAASNRLMLVGISIRETGTTAVDSVTYNGVHLTKLGSDLSPGARVEIWYLVAPTTGTNNVIVNLNNSGGGTSVGVMTFTGVDQSTPLGAYGSNTGDATSGSATINSAVGDLVFGVVAVKDSDQDLVPGGSQTEAWDLFIGSEGNGGGSTIDGAATVNMAWTWSASTDWAIGGVSIKPSDVTAQYYDEFTNLGYDGSDGTIDWSTSPWFEVGDGAGDIFTGAVAVRNSTNAYGGSGNTLKTSCGHANSASGVYIYRELDLSAAESATLTFYLRHDLSGADDISLEISNNGGSTWTVLKNYSVSDPDPGNESYDISPYISPNTQIRFYINTIGSGGSIWTDNIMVEYVAGSGGGSPNTLSGTVFNDVNNNATFEAPDFGEQNVTVNLYEDANQNGILDGPDLILQSTTTAADGSYSFSLTPTGTPSTYSQRVLASADDAESNNDGTNVKVNVAVLGLSSKLDAVRFQNITIPAGSTITNAYLQFTASAQGNQDPSTALISGEQNSNPAAFVEVDGNILDRTPTTNSESWTLPPFSSNITYNSPDLSTIVQELVDDYSGYSNGNMVFLLESVQGQTRTAYTWDADPASAPLLVIEYTEPAGSNYYITTVDQATLPAGYSWTTDNIETAVFTGGGNTNSNNNFGFYDATLNYISGNVFKDMNTNAVNDTPDEGQTSVTVNLYDDVNEDGLVDGGDILITTTTSDVSGAYVFALDNDYSTSGSYSQRVIASADDADERTSNNAVTIDAVDIRHADRTTGVRFQGLTIPSNATISSAYLQFTADRDDSNTPSEVNIYAEDSVNPLAFAEVDNNISSRTKTTNFTFWSLPGYVGGNTYNTPDVSSVIQELVNDNGGLTNAPIAFILDIVNSNKRENVTWDADPSNAPLLVINWTIPAPDFHYVIETDINTLPPGSTLTTDNVETAYFTASGQTDTDNDFGFEPDHLISGTVYEDVNFSGVFDAGDNGQDNVTVYLYKDVNQDGILDGGDSVVDSIDTYTGGAFYFAPILNTATQDTSQVNAIADDAEEILSNGSMDLISSDLELISEAGTDQIVGMRFTNVAIPQGATITNALVEFEVDELDSGVTNLIFSGEDIDDAPSFTTTSYDISSRTKTTSTVTWSNVPAWDTESEKKQSPSIAGIIQEIVNRPGWVSGNDIVILVEGSGERTAEAFEGEPANAPKLIYSWSEGTLPAYYLMTIDENDLPGSGYLVTDNLEAAAYTTSNQSDSGNDFGFVLNTPPTANDDTESTPEDTPLVSNVLSNDTDVESNIDPTSVLIISAATNGTLSVNPTTGVVTYTPNPDYNGTDQYSYSVCDDYSLCDTAIVFITVTPINDDPVATDNSFTVSYNTANQALDVLDAAVADYDVEGNTLQITGAGTDASNGVTTQGGTVVINNNGTPGDYTDDFIDYTPMNGFVGMDTFLYQISDGLGGTDTATVTLTVLSTTEIDCGNGFDDDGDGMLDCDDPDCTPVIPTGISRY